MDKLNRCRGSETVLVVDDHEDIRNLFAGFLESLGYNVITANDGEEGVENFKRHIDDIRIVVMDVMMPKKDGITAYLEIKAIKPELTVFFVSGFQQENKLFHTIPKDQIIQKPCSPLHLATRIRSALDGSPATHPA